MSAKRFHTEGSYFIITTTEPAYHSLERVHNHNNFKEGSVHTWSFNKMSNSIKRHSFSRERKEVCPSQSYATLKRERQKFIDL